MNDVNAYKRPSLREAARRGVQAKQADSAPAVPTLAPPEELSSHNSLLSPTGTATPPAAKKPAPPQRPKPPVVGVEQVVVQCGHSVPFELFDPKKDKYRAERRKKLTDKPCRDCRLKVAEERTRAEMEAARQMRATRPPKPPKTPSPKGGGARIVPRLPDGSRFDVLWDAAKGEWSGTLAVPGLAPFTASASGVFRLLPLLDGLYRAALPVEATPEAPA